MSVHFVAMWKHVDNEYSTTSLPSLVTILLGSLCNIIHSTTTLLFLGWWSIFLVSCCWIKTRWMLDFRSRSLERLWFWCLSYLGCGGDVDDAVLFYFFVAFVRLLLVCACRTSNNKKSLKQQIHWHAMSANNYHLLSLSGAVFAYELHCYHSLQW